MIVDTYKRQENEGYSYLAVPEGKEIPQEATNTDWLNDEKRIELNNEDSQALNIGDLESQISEKGYAISHNH